MQASHKGLMNTMCRSCDHHERYGGKRGHIEFQEPYYCLVCEESTRALFHQDDDFWGVAIECSKCHNYILYVTPEKIIWKDEIYIEEMCVIRNLEDQMTTLDANDKIVLSIKGIMEFNSFSALKKRLKTMMVFS